MRQKVICTGARAVEDDVTQLWLKYLRNFEGCEYHCVS
jgi:hypothetical protein